MKPGEILPAKGEFELNKGRNPIHIEVSNTGDRPIQVGSHYHFFETNDALKFDRKRTKGMRLDIAAGTAVRFEPGQSRSVRLTPYLGAREAHGFQARVSGKLGPIAKAGPSNEGPARISRSAYAGMFGPTTGDRVRLADTELFIEVEKDHTIYGEEVKFGGGKVIRDGMGQSQRTRAQGAVDTVITNALILDHWGIVKADVGIKDGRIVAIGKAGNPDIQPGVTIVIGPGTEAIAGEGKIVTAGGIDCHIHFIAPQQIDDALYSGVTTMMGGGTGPAHGTLATTVTPGPWHMGRMLQAAEGLPMNLGFFGKGNTSKPRRTQGADRGWGLWPQAARGLGHDARLDRQLPHGRRPLRRAGRDPHRHVERVGLRRDDACGLQGPRHRHLPHRGRRRRPCARHHPAGGREERAAVVDQSDVMPYTVNTVDEHLDMLMVCHHLDARIPEDVAFAESRIRRETIAAEDILHDMGAFSMMSSDSQAMGRVGEVVIRTWQTADKMKKQRGRLKEETGDNDNVRAKRYVAKYTINPAITHGISRHVGSVEVGKRADLVIWAPAFFGVKPDMVLIGGSIAAAPMGDPNASIPTPQPVHYRPMFGAFGRSLVMSPALFVSQAGLDKGIARKWGISRPMLAVKGTRKIGKKDMVHNSLWSSKIEVDLETPLPRCVRTASC